MAGCAKKSSTSGSRKSSSSGVRQIWKGFQNYIIAKKFPHHLFSCIKCRSTWFFRITGIFLSCQFRATSSMIIYFFRFICESVGWGFDSLRCSCHKNLNFKRNVSNIKMNNALKYLVQNCSPMPKAHQCQMLTNAKCSPMPNAHQCQTLTPT